MSFTKTKKQKVQQKQSISIVIFVTIADWPKAKKKHTYLYTNQKKPSIAIVNTPLWKKKDSKKTRLINLLNIQIYFVKKMNYTNRNDFINLKLKIYLNNIFIGFNTKNVYICITIIMCIIIENSFVLIFKLTTWSLLWFLR